MRHARDGRGAPAPAHRPNGVMRVRARAANLARCRRRPRSPSVPRFSWAARFATRQRLKGSLWFVPLVCAVAGPLLAQLAITLDASTDPPEAWRYSEETASAMLSAIVSAMVGLTGFVVAFGVLVVQMATQTLSPRFMRLWYRDPLQRAVLGIFVGTLTFALALLRAVGPAVRPGHRRHRRRAGRDGQRRALPHLPGPVRAQPAPGGRGLDGGRVPARACSGPGILPPPTRRDRRARRRAGASPWAPRRRA